MHKKSNITVFLFSIVLIISLIFCPEISKNAVIQGIFISTSVIIPAFFPFTVCVLMIIKSGFRIENKLINKIIYRVFGHNFDIFFIFLMSMIGGYPIGAKLISELYKQNTINDKACDIMLTYCINAGPAFVISVIGNNTFGSNEIGVILFSSHILASIIMAIYFKKPLLKCKIKPRILNINQKTFSQIFVESISDASQTIITICSFVIIFTSINSYIDYYFNNLPILKYTSFFNEVTYAIAKTENIYSIAFLLGFSGISVWFQIFSMFNAKRINMSKFIIGRITHAILGVLITKMMLIVFKIKITAFSNNLFYKNKIFYSNFTLSLSLFVLIVVFLISVQYKNNSGNIIEDVI